MHIKAGPLSPLSQFFSSLHRLSLHPPHLTASRCTTTSLSPPPLPPHSHHNASQRTDCTKYTHVLTLIVDTRSSPAQSTTPMHSRLGRFAARLRLGRLPPGRKKSTKLACARNAQSRVATATKAQTYQAIIVHHRQRQRRAVLSRHIPARTTHTRSLRPSPSLARHSSLLSDPQLLAPSQPVHYLPVRTTRIEF